MGETPFARLRFGQPTFTLTCSDLTQPQSSAMRPPTREAPLHRPLKAIASGTLFQTYTLGLPTHVPPGSVARAHSVAHTRGGAASTAMSILAQFPGVEAHLIAPLGGNEEGKTVLQQLQKENVNTQYCKIWENAGVPGAWVIQAGEYVLPSG